MRLKTIALIGILFSMFHANAQRVNGYEGFYVGLGYEMGLLSIDLKDSNKAFKSSEISNKLRHSVSLTTTYKTASGIDFQLGYLPSQNSMTIEGTVSGQEGGIPGKKFKVNNSYFSHTGFLGAGYNIKIVRDWDLRIGAGISMTFVNDEDALREKLGEDGTKITVENKTIKNNNIHLIAPISITKYFLNGNYLTFGAKYYHSISDSFIEGSVRIPDRELKYSTLNNAIAFHLNYFFMLQTEKDDDCGCLY